MLHTSRIARCCLPAMHWPTLCQTESHQDRISNSAQVHKSDMHGQHGERATTYIKTHFDALFSDSLQDCYQSDQGQTDAAAWPIHVATANESFPLVEVMLGFKHSRLLAAHKSRACNMQLGSR